MADCICHNFCAVFNVLRLPQTACVNTILICSDLKSTKKKTVVNIQLDCFNDFLKQVGIVVSSKSFSTKNKKCVLRSILIPASHYLQHSDGVRYHFKMNHHAQGHRDEGTCQPLQNLKLVQLVIF